MRCLTARSAAGAAHRVGRKMLASSWPCARRRWWRPTWPSTCSVRPRFPPTAQLILPTVDRQPPCPLRDLAGRRVGTDALRAVAAGQWCRARMPARLRARACSASCAKMLGKGDHRLDKVWLSRPTPTPLALPRACSGPPSSPAAVLRAPAARLPSGCSRRLDMSSPTTSTSSTPGQLDDAQPIEVTTPSRSSVARRWGPGAPAAVRRGTPRALRNHSC